MDKFMDTPKTKDLWLEHRHFANEEEADEAIFDFYELCGKLERENSALRDALKRRHAEQSYPMPDYVKAALANALPAAFISSQDDDLARDMACFLHESSQLRDGLFTPPEFIPLVSARLREYLTQR
jgi:hypothetical protein